VSKLLSIDPNRSSGVPLNPQFRNPPPAGIDPKLYDDPTTVPAADLADNPYWKRDVRRSYPRLSVVTQGDVVGLLTVGSQSNPNDEVLQIGEAGTKQLVAVKEEGEKGLAAFFQKDKKNMQGVLAPDGMPPMPTNLAQNGIPTRYDILKEQTYGDEYAIKVLLRY
jgi:hypothetical protein